MDAIEKAKKIYKYAIFCRNLYINMFSFTEKIYNSPFYRYLPFHFTTYLTINIKRLKLFRRKFGGQIWIFNILIGVYNK